MRNPTEVLKNLTEKSKDESYRFRRLYRNLYNRDFYWLAYKNIYANKGSMTAGTDGMTIDGMSNDRIDGIIESLKDHSYRPKPARRTYIAKKNSNKKRPLGIQSGDDKLVQEVVKMILESIYEPCFSNKSHGFRPNRSCQTALSQIQKTFTGTNWFVEGDIHACFDSFDHHVVIDLLRKRIDDEAFIQLIWKFLKAGYMEQWTYERTYSGVPQGSGVSPVLCNVYLNELDRYMEEYAEKFNTAASRKRLATAYRTSIDRAYRYKCKGNVIWDTLTKEERKIRCKGLKQLQRAEKELTPTVVKDSNYKRIVYTRYADDFLIGVIGSKADAEKVKQDVKEFLRDVLKLEMSDAKTKITHTGDRARFLGYDITVSRNQITKKLANGKIQRCQTGVVKLLVPREKWVNKLLEYKAMKIKITDDGKERFVALHRGKLVNSTDIEILTTYNSEIMGLYNYSIANDAYKIGIFANVMKYSMFKTFACKYKTKVHEIRRRYYKDGYFTVAYDTRSGRKTTTFYRSGFARKNAPSKADQINELPQFGKYSKPITLKQRVERNVCELCGKSCNKLEIHQVKKLKDLKGNDEWVCLMKKRRRKTLVVCPDCHKKIHQ